MTLLARRIAARSVFADFIQSHSFITLCLIGGFVSFIGISNELWTPDEPRDAAIGRAMWESGDWIVPRLNGEPFLEKPPLYWWAQSAAVRPIRSRDSNTRPAALRAIRLCRVAAHLRPRPTFFLHENLPRRMSDFAQHSALLAHDSLDRCRQCVALCHHGSVGFFRPS